MKTLTYQYFWLIVALLGATSVLHSHAVSEAWLRLDAKGETLSGTWTAPLHDLDFVFVFDRNADGAVTWQEIVGREKEIAAWIDAGLQVSADGNRLALAVDSLRLEKRDDEAFLVVALGGDPVSSGATIEVEYDLLTNWIPDHRAYLALARNEHSEEAVLRAERKSYVSAPLSSSWDNNFADFFREGVWHIWIGFDHLLFLLVLLLPAVARRTDEPRLGGKRLLWRVLGLVTAFSVAHSITLALSTLGWAELPARPVEIAIAASIVVAAVSSMLPRRLHHLGIALAFAFGLLHGFGFAGVLSELDLAAGNLLATLLAFNLGVEAGQVAVVLALFPLLLGLRQTPWYRPVVVPVASAVIAGVACFWIWQRVGGGGA